jgi:large subunit ribosomal protein L23
MEAYQVILEPIFTEKAISSRSGGCYLFKVHPRATKIDIKQAITKLFKVKAVDVNTVSVRGKKRMVRMKVGHTPAFKKAYVKLAEGQKIEELEV